MRGVTSQRRIAGRAPGMGRFAVVMLGSTISHNLPFDYNNLNPSHVRITLIPSLSTKPHYIIAFSYSPGSCH